VRCPPQACALAFGLRPRLAIKPAWHRLRRRRSGGASERGVPMPLVLWLLRVAAALFELPIARSRDTERSGPLKKMQSHPPFV
jgi:hypothetical protein